MNMYVYIQQRHFCHTQEYKIQKIGIPMIVCFKFFCKLTYVHFHEQIIR